MNYQSNILFLLQNLLFVGVMSGCATVPVNANGAFVQVKACMGLAQPDFSDGRYDCTATDNIGPTEINHLYLNFYTPTDSVQLAKIKLDLSTSSNAKFSGSFSQTRSPKRA